MHIFVIECHYYCFKQWWHSITSKGALSTFLQNGSGRPPGLHMQQQTCNVQMWNMQQQCKTSKYYLHIASLLFCMQARWSAGTVLQECTSSSFGCNWTSRQVITIIIITTTIVMIIIILDIMLVNPLGFWVAFLDEVSGFMSNNGATSEHHHFFKNQHLSWSSWSLWLFWSTNYVQHDPICFHDLLLLLLLSLNTPPCAPLKVLLKMPDTLVKLHVMML